MLRDVISTVAAEYREMPGLSLTLAQAGRLWGLDAVTCESVLMALVDAKVLHRTPQGHFAALPTTFRQATLKAALPQHRRNAVGP